MTQRPKHERRSGGAWLCVAGALAFLGAIAVVRAQEQAPAAAVSAPTGNGGPIAIVPADSGATVTGALQVTAGKTLIVASGSVTSADKMTEVALPRRGTLRVCASTTVKLTSDASVPAGEIPGLMMALDHGAIEADLATGRNSDMVLTPDFRILISGPGTANLKMRLGSKGDTCVDNAGASAPYVLVTSLFGDGMYRVQPGQRVMFEHGSVHEVVDQEKEPCGCPPAVKPGSNEFPLAQSEGLAPLARRAPAPPASNGPTAQTTLPLVYNSAEHAPRPAPAPQAAIPVTSAPIAGPRSAHRRGFFKSIGHFFRVFFGAD